VNDMPFYDDPDDLENKISNAAGVGASLVGKVISLAPLAVAGHVGYARIMANQPVSINSFNKTSGNPTVGQQGESRCVERKLNRSG
jgi:hypothetical protein